MDKKSRHGNKEKPMLKQMVVRIPHDLFKRAKVGAAEREIALQELVARALAEYLKEGRR